MYICIYVFMHVIHVIKIFVQLVKETLEKESTEEGEKGVNILHLHSCDTKR